MARIRTIKPEFFTSEDIVALSPLARLLYVAIWLEADREGRLQWRPKTLKMRYLPADDCDVIALANELVGAGLVVPYEADGMQLAEVPTFTRHQVINNRETASALPARVKDASGTREARVSDAPARVEAEGKEGKEGKGERRVRTGVKTPLPPNFAISSRVQAWAASKGFDRLPEHLEAFRSKAAAKGYSYVDWDEGFMGAIRDDWAGLRQAAGQRVNGTRQPALDCEEQIR